VKTRELKLDIPLGLHVIDMGGGLETESGHKRIESIDMVLCRPMRALLKGLVAPGAWSTQPVQLGFGDLVSSLTRFSMTDRAAEFRGQNLAVITGNYANLSLRLGYHFNIIDTYVSESVDDNYVYFRFVGGVTETERRHLRAVLLKEILHKLNFNVTVSADLVVARLKKLAEPEILEVLTEIGRLIGFTRQLDTQMVSEESIRLCLQAFFANRSESGKSSADS
jgi:pyruvate,water dikinase